jgi:hypothetical protein
VYFIFAVGADIVETKGCRGEVRTKEGGDVYFLTWGVSQGPKFTLVLLAANQQPGINEQYGYRILLPSAHKGFI